MRDSGYETAAANVLITNGGKHAVYNAFATLLDPGDEVLLIAPYWTTYPEVIKLVGGVPVEVSPTRRPGTWPPPSNSRRRAPSGRKCWSSSRRRIRRAPSTPLRPSSRSDAGRHRTDCGW